jgi:hypothetical protein
MRFDFNTSSNNYVDVYLLADSSILSVDEPAGYFVRIGGRDDEICLYRRRAGDTIQKLIDGRNGLTDRRSSVLRLKVTCDNAFNWHLWADTTGTGMTYVSEGRSTDNAPVLPVCYGIVVHQSTASFFQRHFFDDITVMPLIKDTVPPNLLSVSVLNDRELLLQFSEQPDSADALSPGHYVLSNDSHRPSRITLAGHSVRLLFNEPFPSGQSLSLMVSGIMDSAGNQMPARQVSFLYYKPVSLDVVIHEVLSDPDPPVKTLFPEFVEIRNISAYPVQLRQWRLASAAGEAVLPALLLEPDSLLLLCRKDKAVIFTAGERVLGLDNFPALRNDTDTLVLHDAAGNVIHAIAYDKSWFAASGKDKGGWSLEMISPAAPCGGLPGWKPSTSPSGSTPGKPNTAAGRPVDDPPAELLRTELHDSSTALLYFSKTLDSSSAAGTGSYHITPGPLRIATARPLPPLFNTVLLQLSGPLAGDIIYTLRVEGITDCAGMPAAPDNTLTLALPAPADSGLALISELLFDPKPLAAEFVEICNNSARAIDLRDLFLARLDADGLPEEKVPLSAAQQLLLPAQYLALTRDPASLCRYYTCKAWENVLRVSSLPALPNEGGDLALYNASGRLLDLVHYSPDIQSPLAGNTKGVSLERLSFRQPGSDPGNWHPAAITAGGATPGIANSQQLNLRELPGEVTVQPAVFSPDNDGADDVAVVACRLPEAGFVGNITVFDAQGRPVRRLLQSGLLGNRSDIVWDGLGENKQRLPVGIYIIFTEIFDVQGRTKRWKLPVVVARKLN